MPNSIASTTCSSPSNDSVEKIIKNDSVRYKRKGYGLINAILAALTFFFVVPRVLGSVYPSLISGKDHRWFTFITGSLVHTLTNIVCYTVSYFLYTAKSPFIERYKVFDAPWPWESDPKEWKILLKKSLILFAINNFLLAPALILADIFTSGISMRTSPDSLPTCKDIILQLSFCMIIEDFFFYWGHRLLHHPKIYPHIHKIHHQYTQTVSIANEYAHPVEFLVSNLIPSAIGPKLLGKQMHMITFWMWVVLRVGESVDGHCGYDFSWSPFRLLPLSGSSTYHAFHHSANVGNYCSLFTFWDTVFNTNREYWVWLSKRQKDSQLSEIKETYLKLKSKLRKDPSYEASRLDGLKKKTEPSKTEDSSGSHEKAE